MVDQGDVVSVPAGKTFQMVDSFGIYACPDRYKYRTVPYMAFRRKGGGNMDAVFSIVEVFTFSPASAIPKDIPAAYRERLSGYISACNASVLFTPADALHRFYLLARATKFELSHRPAPARNQPGRQYYRLADLTSGDLVVKVASNSTGK